MGPKSIGHRALGIMFFGNWEWGLKASGLKASAKQGIGQTGHWVLGIMFFGNWELGMGPKSIGQTGHRGLGIMFLWGLASSPLLKRWCCYDESS
jgi:hypothetical protein